MRADDLRRDGLRETGALLGDELRQALRQRCNELDVALAPGLGTELPPDAPPTMVFQMFPTVYEIPFHYPHPVTGRETSRALPGAVVTSSTLGMPPEIAAELRAIRAQLGQPVTTEVTVETVTEAVREYIEDELHPGQGVAL